MADYIIATSSTSDLTRDWLDGHSIPFIPYTYTIGRDLYEDDCREESRAAVYAGMRKGDVLKTSMINEFVYEDFFRSLLDTGKDVIFLDMSQKMSVSYENANRAAAAVREDYPGQKLYVMDTLCISGGLGLLVRNMVERMESGMSFDDVIAWGEENKLKIAHRFTVDDLNYLKAGGRVSNASALVGSILSIKPVLYVPDRGCGKKGSRAQGGARRDPGRDPSRPRPDRLHRGGDPHPAGRLRKGRGVCPRYHPCGIPAGGEDRDYRAWRRHRRALRAGASDRVLFLRRKAAGVIHP